MISEKLHDLLSLFVATIFADKRVFASEIETFLSVGKRLNALQGTKETLSEAKLLAWFDMHKDSIRKTVTTGQFEPWLFGCLGRLKHTKDKEPILDIMKDIARSDNDFHVSEKALVVLTANYWGVKVRL